MSENVSGNCKRGWSDEYIRYELEIFRDKDAQKLKCQCVICTCYKFLVIASRLIMTSLRRNLKSGPWKIMKMGHGYKKVGNPWFQWLQKIVFCNSSSHLQD